MTRRSDPRETRLPISAGQLPTFTPVPRHTQRHDGWTDERQIAFIEALADTGSVAAACKVVNMSTVGAYYLRRQPGAETFRKAWEAALQLGVQRIEDVAMDRALNGVDVPVYSYGKLVGSRKSYNDRLLMFMLRNRSPERFSEGKPKALNAMDHTRLEQEKKKWRKEWELGRQTNLPPSRDVRASLDRKIEEIRLRVEADQKREWESLSDQTREAGERFEELKARDLAALSEQQLLPDCDTASVQRAASAAARPSLCEEASEADASRPQGQDKQSTENKIKTIKDDSWRD